MNKWLIPMVLVAAILCTGLTACSIVVGTGPVTDKTYDLSGFQNIEISSAINYDITRSPNYRVNVSAHENLFQYLDVKTSSNILIVRMKPDSHTNSDIHVTISLPELDSITISGASKGSLSGFESNQPLDIEVSGASQLDLEASAGRTRMVVSGASKVKGTLTAQDFRLNLSGASRCELEGRATAGDITVSGASNLFCLDFKTQGCRIGASGASTGRIYCSGNLDIEASGASTVIYSGDPDIKSLNVSGASKVESK
jgi:hypothetical protein